MSKLVSIRAITLAVFLAASVNLGWQFYGMYIEGLERDLLHDKYGIYICYLGPSTAAMARLYIELFLMVALIGGCLRGVKSTLLTVLGLTSVTLIYMLWQQDYFKLAAISGSELQYLRQTAYLLGGTYLDLCIAAVTGLLIVLHLRNAVLRLSPQSGIQLEPNSRVT